MEDVFATSELRDVEHASLIQDHDTMLPMQFNLQNLLDLPNLPNLPKLPNLPALQPMDALMQATWMANDMDCWQHGDYVAQPHRK